MTGPGAVFFVMMSLYADGEMKVLHQEQETDRECLELLSVMKYEAEVLAMTGQIAGYYVECVKFKAPGKKSR